MRAVFYKVKAVKTELYKIKTLSQVSIYTDNVRRYSHWYNYIERQKMKENQHIRRERKKTYIINIIYDVKEREICTVQEIHLRLTAEIK